MRPSAPLLFAALLLAFARAEKLSVLLPGQDGEFSIDHGANGVGLSLPAAAPASLPTSAPAPAFRGASIFNSGVGLQGSIPEISALYDVPDAGSTLQEAVQGACQASTVVVTSRDVVVSTSFSRVVVPTTVVRDRVVTSTDYRVDTRYITSYATISAPAQTFTEVVTRPFTQYQTVTSTIQQVVSVPVTQVSYVTQAVTSRDIQYVTVTRTSQVPVVQTVVSTQVQQEYVTVTATQTQYVANTACGTSSSTANTGGYSYPEPATAGLSSGTAVSGVAGTSGYGYGTAGTSGGYYGGANPSPSYGYPSSYYRPYRPYRVASRPKGVFGKWGK